MRAAIEQGVLPDTYKTQRCHAFDAKGSCPTGTPLATACVEMKRPPVGWFTVLLCWLVMLVSSCI